MERVEDADERKEVRGQARLVVLQATLTAALACAAAVAAPAP